MIRIKKTSVFAAAMIACVCGAASALPTVKITTATPAPSSSQSDYNVSSCANAQAAGSNFVAPTQKYVELKEFSISGAGLLDKSNIAASVDSIRTRGNSTSFMVPTNNNGAKSFRVKFDKRQTLLGMRESKSWALLANFFDPSQMLSAIGFELGNRMGLSDVRPYTFVKLNYNGSDIGVYLLTPQIAANKYGGVNADIENGGWLAEFTHWGPGDAEDCKRFFVATRLSGGSSYKYVLNTKIRAPELDELAPPQITYDNVKNDINEFAAKLNASGFPNNGYRDLIDLNDWAIVTMINLFMDNRDWNTAGDMGGLGSNFLYKENASGKIKAGPLWDLDLAAGSPGVMGGSFFSNSTLTRNLRPSHALYEKLWSDNSGFLPCYVEAWNNNKAMIKAMGENGGFIDSLTEKIAVDVNGNFAMRDGGSGGFGGASGTTYTEQTYRSHVGKLKTWWNTRYTNFDNAVKALNVSGTCPAGNTNIAAPTGTKYVNAARVATARNGVTLNVADRADLRVYGIDGRELRRVSLTRGNHSVRLNDLPRGMYMVRVSIDGEKKTLRVPVR